MSIKFVTELNNESKPPLLVSLDPDSWGEGEVGIVLGKDEENVAKFDLDGTLTLFCCSGDIVMDEYPELFDKDGYLKVRKDGSTKLLK